MKRSTLNVINDIIGHLAEMVAALYISARGFKLLKRRYKNSVYEIDLIGCREKTLLFAEVKFRNSLCDIESAVDHRRIYRIYEASECFLGDFQEYKTCERLFKVFFITPTLMKIMSM